MNWSFWRRALLVFAMLIVVVVALLIGFIGPWPLYADSNFEQSGYFARSLQAIAEGVAASDLESAVEPLKAGWAVRDITPDVGFPMGGYGGRANDKRSEGVKEPILIKALALSDGADTVIVLGTDLLQTLPNLLERVEPRIRERASFTNAQVMYTSSHTHCGPGGLAPGLVAKEAFGEYSPEYLETLATQITSAIVEAVESMAPARIAFAGKDLPDYIRNRTRIGGVVDSRFHLGVVEKIESGDALYLARYSAHGTVYGEEMMLFNGDFAGAFQRKVLERTGHPLLYMGGAVGAMRPYPPGPPMPEPETPEEKLAFENDVESALVRKGRKTLVTLLRDQEARVEAMGAALTDELVEALREPRFLSEVNIESFQANFEPPPAQARLLSPDWRMSPFLFPLLGIPTTGRLQAARIGDNVLLGLPYDVGGEPSVAWQAWASERGVELWVTSFSGAYLGYLSPDANYYDIGQGRHYNENYEIGQMGWFGPNQESYITALVQNTISSLVN